MKVWTFRIWLKIQSEIVDWQDVRSSSCCPFTWLPIYGHHILPESRFNFTKNVNSRNSLLCFKHFAFNIVDFLCLNGWIVSETAFWIWRLRNRVSWIWGDIFRLASKWKPRKWKLRKWKPRKWKPQYVNLRYAGIGVAVWLFLSRNKDWRS